MLVAGYRLHNLSQCCLDLAGSRIWQEPVTDDRGFQSLPGKSGRAVTGSLSQPAPASWVCRSFLSRLCGVQSCGTGEFFAACSTSPAFHYHIITTCPDLSGL